MRVLHFLNSPISADQIVSGGSQLNTSGGWLTAFLGRMLKDTDFSFACVAFGNVKKVQASLSDRIDCFIVPGDLIGKSIDRALRTCSDLVSQWRPDLVHIHGTEAAYGLLTARHMIKTPALISMQGLLGPCSEWYHYFGNSSLLEIVKMHRLLEIPAMRGHWIQFLRIRKMAKREREIITGNRFFMGRTAWDRAYVRSLNPSAKYFHGGEMLRDAFWKKQWNIKNTRRHRIIFTNAGGYPRKGTETLLAAVKLLQPYYPDIQVSIAGSISQRSGYGRYVLERFSEVGRSAIQLGQLNAEQIAKELVDSHVFVSPSYIDNSPNAVCEAQLIGMPVISTYTGGVPSLIEDGRTGLFFPTGDAPMLAARLRELFENDNLAVQLGKQANEVAIERHNPNAIIQEILQAYEHILNRSFQTLEII